LVPVIAVHNFEEWLTIPAFGDAPARIAVNMAARVNLHVEPPTWDAVQLGLLLVTLIPAAIVVWASLGRDSTAKNVAVLWLAGIFLANVVAPHVPAAVLTGGYAPGLVSAVAINLPFCLLLFRAAIRERVLPAKTAILAGALGALSLPFAIIGALALSRLLVAG
jgi:hypothetical protein